MLIAAHFDADAAILTRAAAALILRDAAAFLLRAAAIFDVALRCRLIAAARHAYHMRHIFAIHS